MKLHDRNYALFLDMQKQSEKKSTGFLAEYPALFCLLFFYMELFVAQLELNPAAEPSFLGFLITQIGK